MRILYAYPKWHTVSFSLVAKKHIEYMRRICCLELHEIDELQVPTFTPSSRYTLILHPAFYIMHRVIQSRRDVFGKFREDYFRWWRSNYDQLVGIDVCDSDCFSKYAVMLANRYDKFIVPSKFCVEVAKKSGIKSKVYRVPHGVDPEWYELPNIWESAPVSAISPALLQLYLYKLRKNKKIILFWLWHSGERKGWPEVYEFYTKLRRERDDVVLVLKTWVPNPIEYQQTMHLGCINIYGWISETDKMALFDLADITLNFSRGGGFELNCLESLARGTPCIASDYGSWTDYVPSYLLIKRGKKVQPLPNNVLHSGYGYTVDVEDALNKVHEILDNIEEYKCRVLEWRERVLKKEFRWDVVAKKIVEVLMD